MTRLVSIIVPVFNEEANLLPLFDALRPVIAAIGREFGYRVEVIVNDNHSSDATFPVLKEMLAGHREADFDFRVFRFARNIGFQKSILVGYCKARGDAVVQIDADLQDSPVLILEFIRRWQEGYQIVYGTRRTRQEGYLITTLRSGFYRLINRISEDTLPRDTGDFRLVDRILVDVVCSLRDHDPYLRGLFASLGMRQVGIPYDRAARERGISKFRFADLTRLSMDGITNHSVAPLRLSSYLALGLLSCSSLLGLYYLLGWLFLDLALPLGFMTIVLVQLGGFGMLAFLIGLQGEYISRVYSQVKERPLAIVEESMAAGEGVDPEMGVIEVLWNGRVPNSRTRVPDDLP